MGDAAAPGSAPVAFAIELFQMSHGKENTFMKKMLVFSVGVLLCGFAVRMRAGEAEWNAAAIKECDRACLIAVMDGYGDLRNPQRVDS